MKRKVFGIVCSLCVALTLAPLTAGARGKAAAPQGARVAGRQVVGTVVGIGGRTAGRTRPFTLYVDRITSAEDVGRLNEALRRGDDEMLRVLTRMEAGRIQIGNNVGLPANAILADRQADGTLRLVVLFERNVTLYELRYGTRSENYRFGYAELFIDSRDRGEGTFIGAARLRLRDGNTWEVEDFAVFPARLIGLQARGRVGVR